MTATGPPATQPMLLSEVWTRSVTPLATPASLSCWRRLAVLTHHEALVAAAPSDNSAIQR